MPMPRLRLKNAWPSALMTVEALILLKSGARKYLTPSPALGSMRLTTHITARMTKSRGIMTFERRSMPF